MEKELKKIFRQAKYEENQNLANNIWLKITYKNKRTAQIKMWLASFAGILSLSGLIPAFKILANDLIKSGTYEYLSLIFSNNNYLTYWKEISLSVAESLPTMSIILSLSLIFILFLSFKYASKQIIIKSQLVFN